MKNIFSLNSPIMQGLAKLADLMILNFLYVITCIPIITIGAANAALYDVCHRLSTDDALIWRNYWQAFRSNFKKSTILWVILLLIGALLYGIAIFYWSWNLPNKDLCLILLGIVAMFVVFVYSWSFILQARFENTVKNTLSNALLVSVSYFPRTVAMAILNAVPVYVMAFHPGIFVNTIFIFIIIWYGLSAYLITKLLRKTLKRLSEMAEEVTQ